MKTIKIIAIVAVLAAAGLATWYIGFRKTEAVFAIDTIKPSYGYIAQSVTATGTVQPVDTVAVGTQVSGTLKKIYVDFNSVVKKGQLLAELDKTLFEASVNQYKANLAQAQSQLVYQQGNYNRQSQLYKVGAISKADYDNALYTLNAAKAATGSVQAQLQTAEKNLSLASIYSPIDGTILSRSISEGQTVAASFSTPTLFSIAKDLTKMQVRAAVDEADIGNITTGERTDFTVDAYLNDVFKGKIQEIRLSPSVSSNVVTYTTIINTSNDDRKLKPGMTANITIFTKEVDSTLLIPTKALKYTPSESLEPTYKIQAIANAGKALTNQAYVWVLSGNELVQKKIKTGINNNTQVQVVDGLTNTDHVITNATQLTASEAKQQEASSPFMPKRPGGNNKKK